jgi:hypothetical protein
MDLRLTRPSRGARNAKKLMSSLTFKAFPPIQKADQRRRHSTSIAHGLTFNRQHLYLNIY